MTDTQFAVRLLSLCGTVTLWMTDQILARPNIRYTKDNFASYLEQIRSKLDNIERDFTQ